MFYKTDSNNLFDVRSELQPVIAKWKHIGLALRLNPDKLDEIEKDNRNSSDCLNKVLALWLKRNYNTEEYGDPSWELIAKAVGHPAGGNDPALSQEIRDKWGGITCIALHIF